MGQVALKSTEISKLCQDILLNLGCSFNGVLLYLAIAEISDNKLFKWVC